MWNLDKIKQYISDGVEENIHLDYKGSDSISKASEKKNEISKDVSAFANSDGGIIIYGIKEYDELDKNHLPEKIQPIDGNEYSKEWLEQIINSTISPKIHGVIITPIQTANIKDNLVIYVVEIPKSTTAHQMKDKRYYRRYNFQSIPMDDWEIKDIINRTTQTKFEIYFETTPNKKILEKWPPLPPKIKIDIWVYNSGNKVIKYLDCFVSGNDETAKNISDPYFSGEFQKHFSNTIDREVTIKNTPFTINTERIAILPSTSRHIGSIEIRENFILQNNKINFQISTEDRVEHFTYTGKEIIE
ncbi:putative DNA-binding protein [Flavobacterium sp. 90]|uniref:AlbA family DNA-binding domain-containing protein n=1 Tax=unclassified Flavobacterium TaxID=196869 RepID=UPI000EB4AA75|nr:MULTISPECIES: ATP-binding protein [unclassified Flavobacterium]RKR09844.1 putative DNA-binding protein [Flavobacterium sp. 81]TCK53630.1 putative DNA-binding protein [Flavobacterium sp. 90]